MIIVRMIQYWNDYHEKEITERFKGLRELEDWMFGQMRVDYSSKCGSGLLYFPNCDVKEDIRAISVQPEYGSYVFWIRIIEDDYAGILFSDGIFTAGQKHCTKMVREWLAGCEKRKKAPRFRFAADDFRDDALHGCVGEPNIDRNARDCGEDMVSRRLIMKAAKRIYDAGGCGAEDEYSEGYDAINFALDILLEEAGCTVDDVLSYDGNGRE